MWGPPMSKTLGLISNVLLVDKPYDLVQVECYLPSEGALVHYWYHVSSLQRPLPGYHRSPAMKGAEVACSPHVHRLVLLRNFMKLLEQNYVFALTLNTLDGGVQELCKDGSNITVNWNNHADYVRLLREKRIEELACRERISAVKCELATIIPLEMLSVFNEEVLDLRVCGIPEVDLDYLKVNTMYQIGLMETDKHVQYFWEALASFSQEELRKFIKFAYNQERIPHTCPCRDGRSDITCVPPYPMKIAPPDGSGAADSRYI